MTDKRSAVGGEREVGDTGANPPRRLLTDKPDRKRGRYQSFLLSTLFTYGGDE
jgi:hypothetical protein